LGKAPVVIQFWGHVADPLLQYGRKNLMFSEKPDSKKKLRMAVFS